LAIEMHLAFAYFHLILLENNKKLIGSKEVKFSNILLHKDQDIELSEWDLLDDKKNRSGFIKLFVKFTDAPENILLNQSEVLFLSNQF
jgi:hypothetical protein